MWYSILKMLQNWCVRTVFNMSYYLVITIVALLGSTSAYPDHAECTVEWQIPLNCDAVRSGLICIMGDWAGDKDSGRDKCPSTSSQCPRLPCGQRCLYTYKAEESSQTIVVGVHLTPGLATDSIFSGFFCKKNIILPGGQIGVRIDSPIYGCLTSSAVPGVPCYIKCWVQSAGTWSAMFLSAVTVSAGYQECCPLSAALFSQVLLVFSEKNNWSSLLCLLMRVYPL